MSNVNSPRQMASLLSSEQPASGVSLTLLGNVLLKLWQILKSILRWPFLQNKMMTLPGGLVPGNKA